MAADAAAANRAATKSIKMHLNQALPPANDTSHQVAGVKQLAPSTSSQHTNFSRARRKTDRNIHVACQMAPIVVIAVSLALMLPTLARSTSTNSGLRFDPETSSYSDLTFTFDPRLDKHVESLHFEHWLNIMQDSSKILHEALNGRAHLSEVRVLVPFKWRHLKWAMGKPGAPIMTNRKLRYIDSDVIVGFDGLQIKMPISFLEQPNPSGPAQVDTRLRARQLVREFASHRYGLFKESGFRSDPMYPPLVGTPGRMQPTNWSQQVQFFEHTGSGGTTDHMRGFDGTWNECPFETRIKDGRPSGQSMNCLPYLNASSLETTAEPISFNLMGGDLFAYSPVAGEGPLEWRQVSETARFHFCGDNFAPLTGAEQVPDLGANVESRPKQLVRQVNLVHNQLAPNKQNVACQERSALDVIRGNDDFRRMSMRLPNFRRLPKLKFNFFQEMAPRVILAVEYGANLYQSRRLEQGVLEAAIGKWLAYDLVPETELAIVLFGQNLSRRVTGQHFRKLESSLESRLGLYSPNIDPFEEEAQTYNEQELLQLEFTPQTAAASQRLIKGTCSFERALVEALNLMPARHQYDDQGGQLILVTSGLFVEDEARLEELLRSHDFGGATPGDTGSVRIELVVYPSNGLYDTRPVDSNQPHLLDQLESQQLIRSRLAKLLTIRRLTGANIHLIREKLDSEGNVKMSSLVQFYQVFEHLSRGHSWDRTNSMVLLDEAPVEARAGPAGSRTLHFSFELDGSLKNQLMVGFLEPRQQAPQGKRFALKHLQLRAPNGQLVLNTSSPTGSPDAAEQQGEATGSSQHDKEPQAESLMFPHRAQLGFAGFQLGPEVLNGSRPLAGRWTLSAVSHGPIHTHALALARLNPEGDSISGRCWTQSSFFTETSQVEPEGAPAAANNQGAVRQVKVFAQVESSSGSVQEGVQARLEVHDEQGNIVQNVQMLDDGLGAPDMTRADGLLTQWVQRAHRPGFYKAYVELSGSTGSGGSSQGGRLQSAAIGQFGQDNVCCGSFVGSSANQPQVQSTRHLSRRLYCGTFYVDPSNRLGQQPPPRVANLTVVQVDQETRRVTLRWPEPLAVDISSAGSAPIGPSPVRRAISADNQQGRAIILEQPANSQSDQNGLGALISGAPQTNRYEIKMFDDRNQLKRAFDSVEPEVGFRFGENQVEGPFPNASQYGGWKEVTLRVPSMGGKHSSSQLLYVALKIYNKLGLASQLSNIVEFELRRPLADQLDEFGYPIGGLDASGQSLDGERWSGSSGQSGGEFGNYMGNLIRSGTGSMRDGLGLLMLICILASVLALICISLVGCLVQSARDSMAGPRKPQNNHPHHKHDQRKGGHRTGSGQADDLLEPIEGELAVGFVGHQGASTKQSAVSSASSSELVMASTSSSGAGSSVASQQDELDVGKLMGVAGHHYQLDFNQQEQQLLAHGTLEAQQAQQQHQAQMIQQQQQPNYWQLQHTMVNGYAYATVGHQPHQMAATGDLNQDGLTGALPPVTSSWSNELADQPETVLYDKVRHHRDTGADHAQLAAQPGLPDPTTVSSYLVRSNHLHHQQQMQQQQQQQQQHQHQQQQQHQPSTNDFLNQQLQAQLSSVLRSRDRKLAAPDSGQRSSPALAGITPDDIDQLGSHSQLYQQFSGVAQPPTHYGIQQAQQLHHHQDGGQIIDPSIYSQSTHLQQVSLADQHQNYYANSAAQWENYSSNGSLSAQHIINNNNNNNSNNQMRHQHYHQQADTRAGSISEV